MRLHHVLEQLTRGEKAEEIRFRKGDLLIELEDTFNKYLDSINKSEASQADQQSSPASNAPDRELSEEELQTMVSEIQELSQTAQSSAS